MPSNKIDIWNMALDKIGETDGIESETDDRVATNVCNRHYENILRQVLESAEWPWATRQAPLTEITTESVTLNLTSTPAIDGIASSFDLTLPFISSSQISIVYNAGSDVDWVEGTDYSVTPADLETATNAQINALGGVPGQGATMVITVSRSRIGWDKIYSLPADFVSPIAILYGGERYNLLSVRGRQEFAILPNDSADGLVFCTNMTSDDIDAFEYVGLIRYVPMMSGHFVDAVAWRLAMELAYALKKDVRTAAHAKQMYQLAISAAIAQGYNSGTQLNDEPITPSEAARG